MSTPARIISFFRNLVHRNRQDADLDAELLSAIHHLADQKIKEGMNAQDALRAAKIELGGLEQLKETVRVSRTGAWFDTLLRDIRFALRMLRKNPGFTATAVLTLALGIGANTAMFSVVNSVLLRPLPYPEPSRLVLFELQMQRGAVNDALTVPQFQFLRDHNGSFEEVAGSRGGSDTRIRTGQGFQWVSSTSVTDGYFRALGQGPVMGREFVREETQPAGPPSVILTDGIWRSAFGADPQIIGRQIELDDKPYTVVGVLPRGFRVVDGAPDIFMPLRLGTTLSDRGMNTEVLGRLKRDVNFHTAQADINIVYNQFHRQDSSPQGDRGVQLVGYQDWLVGDVKPSLLLLFGAVGLLLLVSCANVASLFLARSNVREREISIRLALGAGRFRLFRQFLTEGFVVTFLSGAAGLLAAKSSLTALTASIPFYLPANVTINIDAGVLAFTFAVAIVTSVFFSLTSFWNTSKLDLESSLREGAKGIVSKGRNNVGRALVVAEVALSVTLLIGAGLLIESLYRLRQQSLGFDPRDVVTMTTPFATPKSAPPSAAWSSQQQILTRIQALPAVLSVAVVSAPPLMGQPNLPTQREGHPEDSIGGMEIQKISSDYFRTLRIPLLQGRAFLQSDSAGSEPVALINEGLARQWWHASSPIGDHVIVGMMGGKLYTGAAVPRLVVGVVGDVKGRAVRTAAPPTVYLPVSQIASDGGNPPPGWVIRTSPGTNIASALRSVVEDVNPGQRVLLLTSMERIVNNSVAGPNFDAQLLGFFAALALVLTAVGIYGLLSFHVVQRTREIGIRMALGARPGEVLATILAQGLKLVAVGVALGSAAAFMLAKFLQGMLYGVTARDPLVFLSGTVALVVVSVAACYIPARRAMRVDPVIAMRCE